MAKLEGKVAVVTGASKGIGAAVAVRLAEDGAAVVVNYSSSPEGAQKVVSRITEQGGRAIAVQANVSQAGDVKKLFDAAVREFGKCDILVNNAGIFEFLPLAAIHEDHFDRQFSTNVKGLLFASQAAANSFNGHGGLIVNISSVVSTRPLPNGSVYSATKAAVDAITKSLARELGPRQIRVNSVLPGPTETEGFIAMPGSADIRAQVLPLTPLGRIGRPMDIAGAVSFLASEDAAWITGQIIPVSGGFD